MPRLLVLNPNTTASMTRTIGAAARAVAAQGTEILDRNPAMGPASVEGWYDEALCLPGMLQEIARGEAEGVDGHLIACFDDPGLDAARCRATAPVVGCAEAGLHMASLIAGRFAVVTTLSRSVATIEHLAHRYGVAGRCAVRATDIPVLDLEIPGSAAEDRIAGEIDRAIADDRAEAIVLGCAGMADLAGRLSARAGVPVIDGVAAGVKLLEGLAGLGLRTSKAGPYAPPRPKQYAGALAAFAPPAAPGDG
ncbi:aspartate/glutamate racemase family protein [Roseospira marina]|uniref:Hydantoin racemase n=1 Tax=Roseospira marina TaxID=140057 RepID=A0A5M6IDP6_9PROT|nr:aspartate/glutamate racemase family protein [Roseospira marina]KAA5606363.1 aspartate/glutamate racemase family protein [Roseospira marina]MBB4314238.1 allantoin racemase [Roseospira marina]MBB5087398.1 allantoin racemase [Roseospira marina]